MRVGMARSGSGRGIGSTSVHRSIGKRGVLGQGRGRSQHGAGCCAELRACGRPARQPALCAGSTCMHACSPDTDSCHIHVRRLHLHSRACRLLCLWQVSTRVRVVVEAGPELDALRAAAREQGTELLQLLGPRGALARAKVGCAAGGRRQTHTCTCLRHTWPEPPRMHAGLPG